MSDQEERSIETPTENEHFSIDELLDNSFAYAGHGTSREIVEKVIQEGIKVSIEYTHPSQIVLGLDTSSRDVLYNQLRHWPHKSSQAIVIVGTPNTDAFLRKESYMTSIDDENLQKLRTLIPSKFIRGYYDVQADIFISNPKWEFDPQPLEPQSIKAKGFSRFAPVSDKARQALNEIVTQGGEDETDDPDIW